MEVETESSSYNDNLNINPIINNNKINNLYSNENIPFNTFNKFNYFMNNKSFSNLFNAKKFIKKRTYNDLMNNNPENIYLNDKESKEMKNAFNTLYQKILKLDFDNNFLTYSQYEKNEKLKMDKNKKEKEKNSNKNDTTSIDYSVVDLNYILFQLYRSNKISNELKQFMLKKLVSNAIEIERTFNNYFNLNKMPNKK